MSDSFRPHGLYSPWNSSGQNIGVCSLSLLQRIFPTQGSNQGLPHCRQILYQLSYQGSPLYFGTTQIPNTPLPPRSFHLALGNSHSKIDRLSSRGTLPLSGLELNMVLPSRYHFHCTSLQWTMLIHLLFTWTTLHLLVIIFAYIKSKIRFHKGRQEASAHSDNIYHGKMCVKYVNLSICLISHLHIKILLKESW